MSDDAKFIWPVCFLPAFLYAQPINGRDPTASWSSPPVSLLADGRQPRAPSGPIGRIGLFVWCVFGSTAGRHPPPGRSTQCGGFLRSPTGQPQLPWKALRPSTAHGRLGSVISFEEPGRPASHRLARLVAAALTATRGQKERQDEHDSDDQERRHAAEVRTHLAPPFQRGTPTVGGRFVSVPACGWTVDGKQAGLSPDAASERDRRAPASRFTSWHRPVPPAAPERLVHTQRK
jgi:hypothetical protein